MKKNGEGGKEKKKDKRRITKLEMALDVEMGRVSLAGRSIDTRRGMIAYTEGRATRASEREGGEEE